MNFEQSLANLHRSHVIALPLPQLRKVDRSKGSLQAQAYRELRRGLMVGAFVPGQAVSLRTVAERLGTSPMPVRDAVNRLIAERALQMLPNRSVVVPVLSRDEFSELTMMRQLLEGQATEQACAHATPELVGSLRRLNDKLLSDIESRNAPKILESHQQFHFAIYRASNYRLMLPMIESLWLQVGPVMNISVTASPLQWDAAHHAGILDAMNIRDGKTARREMERDIAATIGYLLEKLDEATRHASADPMEDAV